MILIAIQGMSDGARDVELEFPVDKIDNILPEFFGNITLKGTLRRLNDRFAFAGKASCMARFVCDRSLKEFDMLIEAEISISFLRENDSDKIDMNKIGKHSDEAEFEVNIIKHDDKQIDLTEEVIQGLAVSIPMKKISPEYEDVDFNEILLGQTGRKVEENNDEGITNIVEENTNIDDRWSELRKIKTN